MNTLRTTTFGLALLALAGLAAAPAAQASGGIGQINLCPYPNPDAWVNYCITVDPHSKTVNAYTVDTTPDYTTVCPVTSLCVNVPVVLSLIDPYTYTVTYYTSNPSVDVNTAKVVEDVCDVIGIVCALIPQLLSETSGSTALPHGLELQGFGDLEGDGVLDLAFFSLPSGETVALPIVH